MLNSVLICSDLEDFSFLTTTYSVYELLRANSRKVK